MELILLLVNGKFWIGYLFGGLSVFIFYPLLKKGIDKIFRKN